MLRALLILLAVVSTWSAAPSASAQTDETPSSTAATPDQAQDAADRVVITSPAAGEAVTPPLLVIGRAPAGARLRLEIDGTFSHVFRADASGNFRTAVPAEDLREVKQLSVHLLDRRGDALAVSTVEISLGDARSRLTDVEKARAVEKEEQPAAPDAGENDTSSSADESAQEVSPWQRDDDPAVPSSAPEPPSIEEGTAQAEPEISPSVQAAPTSQESASAQTREGTVLVHNSWSRSARILVESLVGVGCAIGCTIGAFTIGAMVGMTVNADAALALGTVAAVGVGILGVPSVMAYAGDKMGGSGSWVATLGGYAIGLAVGTAVIVLAAANHARDLGAAAAIGTGFVTPLAGAVLGYELTSDDSSEASAVLTPFFTIGTPGKGAQAGLRLHF